jgi:hypothetical protein
MSSLGISLGWQTYWVVGPKPWQEWESEVSFKTMVHQRAGRVRLQKTKGLSGGSLDCHLHWRILLKT